VKAPQQRYGQMVDVVVQKAQQADAGRKCGQQS
jgi:hypothetical protein